MAGHEPGSMGDGRFATTNWTLIAAARGEDLPGRGGPWATSARPTGIRSTPTSGGGAIQPIGPRT